jgi:hypothetical protein
MNRDFKVTAISITNDLFKKKDENTYMNRWKISA